MQIIWLGQNSFKLIIDSLKIIIDPYAGNNEDYAPCDLLLITHSHFDHFNLEKTKRCINDNTIVFGPSDVASRLAVCHTVSPEEKHEINNILIQVIPAYNQNHDRENSFGYLIKGKNKSIYFAGDTDYIPEMNNIKADIVVLPVGGTYTMGAKEAAKAAETIEPKIAIPCHYGSIVGTKDDAIFFKELVEEKGIKGIILKLGVEQEL